MLKKLEIFFDDLESIGLYRSITHRVYKHPSLAFVVPIINFLKPESVDLDGLTIYIDKNDTVVSESLIYFNSWSEPEVKLLKKHLKKGQVFVDVGAHIGVFTLTAAKLVGPKGHVYAFEPNPNSFKLLKKNVKANKFKNVTLFNMAVTDKVSKTSLYVNNQNTGDTRISKPGIPSRKIKVETTNLDRVLKNTKVDFMKIDVQGAEMLVLKGAEKVLVKNKKMKTLLEVWPYGLNKLKTSGKNLIKMISDMGFKVYSVSDKSLNRIDAQKLDKLSSEQGINVFITK